MADVVWWGTWWPVAVACLLNFWFGVWVGHVVLPWVKRKQEEAGKEP
jgi:hypothetical protein